MAEGAVQFYESEWGNRYLLNDGVDIAFARDIALAVLDTHMYPRLSLGGLRHVINRRRLDKLTTVTMGSYDDEFVSYTPASGCDLAQLVLIGTEDL